MDRDSDRPEWLRRCDAVNATEEPQIDDPIRRLASNPLLTLIVITVYVLALPFIKLYAWLRR